MELDKLIVNIDAETKDASGSIKKLTENLMSLSSALGGVETGNLNQLSNGIKGISSAMSTYKQSGVTASTFNGLATALGKMATVNSVGLTSLGNSLANAIAPLKEIATLSSTATAIRDLSKGISTLGNDRVQKATEYLPKLGVALKEFMTIMSKAPMVSQNLIDMTNALANFTRNGQKVGSSLNGLNSGFKENIKQHTSMVRGLGSMSKGFRSLASSIGMFYMKFWIVIRLFKQFLNMVESAMDYVESFNFFDVAITNATKDWKKLGYESADAYAKSFESRLSELNEKMSGFAVDVETGDLATSTMDNLGINLQKLITFESEIVSITSSLGLCGETATTTAEAMAMLSADMSSLHNIDLDTVFKNFQSGLIGQSRALYKYGLDITNATLSTYALANGVTKSVQSMTQAEKMQLRVLAIFQQLNGELAQSENSWGDLANTIEQPANQLRKLQNGFKNLGILMGRIFLPVITNLLPYLNALVIVLQRVAESIANFFGVSIDANSSATGVTDVLDDMEESAESTEDAIEKLNKQLASFDRLNNLTTSSNSRANEIIDSIDLSEQIADAVANYKEVWDKAYSNIEDKATQIANKIVSIFGKEGMNGIGTLLSDTIADQLSKIKWNRVYESAKNFGKGFANFLNGLIKPSTFAIVGSTVAKSLNTAVYNALSFGVTLDWSNVGNSIAIGINNFFEKFDFKSLAKTINTFVQGLYDALKTAIKKINWNKIYDSFIEVIKNIDIGTIAIVIGALSIKKIGTIIGVVGLKNAISTLLTKALVGIPITLKSAKIILSGGLIDGKSIASKIADSIALALGGAGTLNESLTLNFGSLKTTLMGISSIIGGLVLSATNFFSQLQSGFDGVKTAIMLVGDAFVGLGAVILGANPLVGVAIAGTLAIFEGLAIAVSEQTKKIGEVIAETFKNPDGTPLEEIVSSASEKMKAFGDYFDYINQKANGLNSAKTSIKETGDSIEIIETKMKAGVLTVDEGCEQLIASFKSLADDSKTYFSQLESVLISAFSTDGYLYNSMKALGINVDAVKENIVSGIDSINKKVEDLNTQLANADPGSAEYTALKEQLESLTGSLSDVDVCLKDFNYDLSNIDYSTLIVDGKFDVDKAKSVLNELSSAYSSTNKSISENQKLITDSMEEYIKKVKASGGEVNQETINAFNSLKSVYENANDELKEPFENIVYTIQNDLINNVSEVIISAEKEWENLNVFEKAFYGSKHEYVEKAISQYRKNYVDPIDEAIDEMYKEVGINGSAYVTDAVNGILQTMLQIRIDPTSVNGSVLKNGIDGMIKESLKDVPTTAYNTGKTIGESLTNGISNTLKNASVLKTVADSTVGVANAIKKSLASDNLVEFYYQNNSTKAKSSLGSLSIKTYATGGFPEDGLFMANHNELVGRFSNGKTAVANNQQITDGIEQASYRGFIRALSESGSSNVNITLEGDADNLFRVIKQQATTYQKRTGSPAFGY